MGIGLVPWGLRSNGYLGMATHVRCALASLDGLSLSSIIEHGVMWSHGRPFAWYQHGGDA